MMRAVTVPSAATSVPRFCSENSPERCRVLGSIRSTLLGGLMLRVSAVNTMMLIVAATRTPTPNAQVNSVPRTQRSCVSRGWSVTALTHNAARQKDKEVNCEITQHHERDRTSRQHGCAKRYGSQHRAQCCLIDIGLFERVVGGARLIDWHASHPSLLGSTVEYLCTHDEQNQAFFIGQKPQSSLAGASNHGNSGIRSTSVCARLQQQSQRSVSLNSMRRLR